MGITVQKIRNKANAFVQHALPTTLIVIAVLTPLKLSLTYLALIPSLLIWLCSSSAKEAIQRTLELTFIRPLILFILLSAFTALFGLRPVLSILQLAELSFFILTVPFFVAGLKRIAPVKLLLALLLGQSIASYHTLLQSAYPQSIQRLFIGAVSEAGQLTLMIPLTLAVAITIFREVRQSEIPYTTLVPSLQDGLHFIAHIFLFGAFGFSAYFGAPALLQILLAIAAGALVLNSLVVLSREIATPECNSYRIYETTIRVLLPLLLTALLANLKRGPWLGVTLGISILLLLYYRKILLPLGVVSFLAIVLVSPIRDRLAQSSQHFFISGGRSTIWSVGTELSVQYPLGVGYENSSFLREFAPEVPPELIHFHNNFLNILVETGWLGLFVFIWWVIAVAKFCFSHSIAPTYRPIMRGIGCSFIAWQTAGLVEYNFGDSEVLLVVLLTLSMLVAYSENGFSQYADRQPANV